MKKHFEGILSEYGRRKSQRRRMTALLLVLSLFVTSGVSWALHGVGLTMANEAKCGLAEHVHTDACYQRTLICGLDSDKAHTHTDACYEKKLICRTAEHVHDISCYTGSTALPDAATAGQADETGDPEEYTEYAEAYEAGFRIMADGDEPDMMDDPDMTNQSDEATPLATVKTIDNIAEGIHFTLFDYGDPSLESAGNNYDYSQHWDGDTNSWVPDGPPYTHNNVRTSGINTDRDPATDIMFLAYGTPVPFGANDGTVWNYEDSEGRHYQPDKNNYSGDYNAEHYYSGNRPVQNIVAKVLGTDGYPHIANADGSLGNSLAYLFDPTQSEYKTVYQDVNHLLQERISENRVSHLYYNSNENYAYFNPDTYNFDVYNQTFEIINDNHHYEGDVNNIKFDASEQPIVYTEDKDPGFKIGFFPFDPYDDTRRDPNYDGNGYNHHFGMTMEATFSNPEFDGENVKEPITFKYSGDDDMWVFLDGRLVLDIGGIHEPAGGMIDFSHGLVWVQDNGTGQTIEEVRASLTAQGYVGSSDAEWAKFPQPIAINTASTSTNEVNRWKITKLEDYFTDYIDPETGERYYENPDPDEGGLIKWEQHSSHTIKVFYLERGGCYSNLAMEMNLPTLKPLTIKKDVNYQDHLVKDPLIDEKVFTFEIWEYIVDDAETGEGHWTEPDDIPHTVTLKAGDRKTFDNLGQDRQFMVTEVGVDPGIFDQVSINGAATDLTGMSVLTDVSLGSAIPLREINAYNFENRVIQETTSITVKKTWDCDENKIPADYTIKYKIMRSDSATGEIRQIALRYTDPENPDKIKKRRTFALPPEKQLPGETFTGLLSRYGDHVFSYTVEELNVPDGFKPMYNYSTPGVLEITNTDISNVDIYLEKQWENQPDPAPEIALVLKRKKTGYSGSQKTSVKVNMLDEAGNLITSYTTHDVYAGGTAELPYYWPDGVELYHYEGIVLDENSTVDTVYPASYPQKTPDSLGVKFETDEGVLVVSNLKAKTDPNDANEIPNVVSFKIRTDNAADTLLLEHHSFTRGTNGWDVQNDMSKQPYAATVENTGSGGESYARDDALIVRNRTKSFNGAMLYLDPAKFRGNKTYTFTTYVYSPVDDRFKMTFNNGLGTFQPISDYINVPAGVWTKLTGTVKLTDTIDPYNMFLLIESEPYTNGDDNEACRGSEFRIDEFIAVEGNQPVEVARNSGTVTVEPDKTVYSIQFNNTTGTWQKNGEGVTMTPDHDTQNGFDFMVVGGRNAESEGVKLMVPFLEKGHTYQFESYVQGNGNNNISNVILSIDTIEGSGSISRWQNIGSAAVNVNGNTFRGNTITGTFPIPDYAVQDQMYIYYETRYESGELGSFRIHNLTITDITDPYTPKPMAGYTITDGKYVSNFTLYDIELDENSVTNPLHLNTETETVETVQTITMSTSPWSFHWDKEALNEQSGFIYEYWIEELTVGGSEVLAPDEQGRILTADGNYLVSYSGNNVATNDEDNPIVVSNKYIWYKLPPTGGMGTDVIYGSGLFLVITGYIGGYAFKRRERRFK